MGGDGCNDVTVPTRMGDNRCLRTVVKLRELVDPQFSALFLMIWIIRSVLLCMMMSRCSYSLVFRASALIRNRSLAKFMSTQVSSGGVNFYGSTKEDLAALLASWGQPSYRVKQINEWVFEKGITDFDKMTGLPKDLREKLKTFYDIGTLKLVSEQVSRDGTRKRAYELKDGQIIESVLMPYDDGRRTACISSQAGCGMGCVFCATGQMGFSRQLSSAEIFEQAQIFSTELKRKGERLSNIVFMGMGEPLANYDNVLQAVRRLNTDLGIGARHITISTVGLAPRIRKLAEEGIQVGLAVSLHQASDAKRSALMPVNKRYPIPELLDACRYYIEKTNRRISFEWALIRDDTDTEDTARELGKLLKGILCHVNVIPLNPTAKFGGKPTSKEGVQRFIDVLAEYGVTATARVRRGIDIDAGCGQLKAELIRRRKPSTAAGEGAVAATADSAEGGAAPACSGGSRQTVQSGGGDSSSSVSSL